MILAAPNIEITQGWEWDTPFSATFLMIAGVLFLGWTIWQLIREGLTAGSHWWMLFAVTRTIVAAVLLWMILGPTTVLTRTETHQRTLALYVDTSSSMQIRDQVNPAEDWRWQPTEKYQAQPRAIADRIAFLGTALKNHTLRLADAFDEQATVDERVEIVDRLKKILGQCRKWLGTDGLETSLSADLRTTLRTLHATAKDELQPMLDDSVWTDRQSIDDREQRLQQLTEIANQFALRCRILSDELAASNQTIEQISLMPADGSPPSRLDKIVPPIQRALSEWMKSNPDQQASYRVRIAQFFDNVSALPLENWESSLNRDDDSPNPSQIRRTDLTEVLRQIRDESAKEDFAAAVILTDGRQTLTTDDDPRNLATQIRLPLFVVPIGQAEMKRDVILHHVHAPNSVIQKDKILIDGIVTAYRCADKTCDIQLVENDRVIQTRQSTFAAEQDDQRFQFEIPTDHVGRREFTIRVQSLSEENSVENNSKTVAVDITDAMIRILLADGQARWEHQYLVNLFTRQDTVELDQLKFAPSVTGTGRLKNRPRLPETVQEWSEYRLVILGDISPRHFSQKSQQGLREYVTQRGGNVVLIAGQNDMPQSYVNEPVEQILPVERVTPFSPDKKGYRVEMTSEGRTSEVMQFADDIATTEQVWHETGHSLPMYFLSSYHRAKPNSHVFLNAVSVSGSGDARKSISTADVPVFLCWQDVGAGRVVYLASPATYQLRNRSGDKHHHRFWGQLVRWIISRSALSGSKSVKLLADKSHYNQGDTAQLTVELTNTEGQPVTNASPHIDVVARGETVAQVELEADAKVPGRYSGKFISKSADQFMVKAAGTDVEKLLTAERYPNPVQLQIEFEPGLDRELADPRSDRPLLEYLAERTGGVVCEPTALSEVANVVSLRPRVQSSSQKTSLWDRWWCLWLVVGCLSVEWIIRKQVGLA